MSRISGYIATYFRKLYFVKMDITKAFDTIDQEMLLKEAYLHDDQFAREVSRLVLQEQGLLKLDQEREAP